MTAALAPSALDALVEAYLSASPGGVRSRSAILGRLAQTARSVPVRKLGRRNIERWLATRSSVTTATRQTELVEVKRFCKWLLENGHVGKDPCDAVQPLDDDEWGVGFVQSATAGPTLSSLREDLLLRGLATRTVNRYQRVILDAEGWCEDRGHDLTRAPAHVIAGYVAARPPSYATRAQMRAALSHYWEIHGRKEPPVGVIRVPPAPRMVCRALDEADAQRLAATAKEMGEPEGWAVLLGLYQGLRRAEIASLRWDNFTEAGLRVTGKGELTATIPVHGVIAEMLASGGPGEWIFPGRFGGPVGPNTVWDWVRTVADRAGVEGITVHRLRHTCLATANDATGDLRAVQAFARHAKPETTAGYTRASARRLNAVVTSISYEDNDG